MELLDHIHKENIRFCLSQFDLSPMNIDYVELVNEGLSGVFVYKLKINNFDIYLKYSSPASPDYGRQRSLREYYFYNELSNTLKGSVVPKLINSFMIDDRYIGLFLKAYNGSPEPVKWDLKLLQSVMNSAASLHAQFWNDSSLLYKYKWLAENKPFFSLEPANNSMQHWKDIIDRRRLHEHPASRNLERLFMAMETICSNLSSTAKTLCHGDFHMRNILLDEYNKPVLTDWQEVCYGSGPADIAFFLQRALGSGVVIPETELQEYYLQKLQELSGSAVDKHSVEEIINSSKLYTALMRWPYYLKQASDSIITAIMADICESSSNIGL